jgi:hypothetical protein
MRSTKVSKWTPRLMLLAPLLCAACTTVSVDAPEQRQCSRYVDLFLDRTEHAPAPGTSQASHVAFEAAEAGQLELSDRDKVLAKQVLHMCEQEGADALARAKRSMKPFWKRIFSSSELRQQRPWAQPS